jgi:hypothetical protein
MLTPSQLTPAQRHIREARLNPSATIGRIADHRLQLARVRESIARVPDQPRHRE